MGLILRVIGVFWIVLSAKPVFYAVKRVIATASPAALNVRDLIYLLLLAGGIGLALLQEWGRWTVLIGLSALLILLIGPSLIHGNINPLFFKYLVFYGIFIGLLLLPQARGSTQK